MTRRDWTAAAPARIGMRLPLQLSRQVSARACPHAAGRLSEPECLQMQAGHRSERDTGHRPAGVDDLRGGSEGQPAPTSAFSNRTASREKEFASTQPNFRNDQILIVPDGSPSCRHQAVCPSSRSSGPKQPVRLAGSYHCWFVKNYWLVCVREKYCSD